MATSSTGINLQVNITYRQILQIALPITASILVPQINFITNNVFLGGIGQQALAVAGITGVYYLIFAVIGNGFSTGLQALISRRAGENRPEEISSLFAQGVRITLAMSIFGILFTWFIAPTVLAHVMHDKSNIQLAVNFLHIRIVGLPILYLYLLRNAVLVGTNQSKYLVIGTAVEAITNIFFDYTLIQGRLGFPALGFNGAAYASIIAEFAGLASILIVLKYNKTIRQLNLFKSLKYNKENLRLVLVKSSPLVAQYAISIISWEFFYILIERNDGQIDLAVSNTMRNIFGFFGCFTWAFAATANTMVSNVIGQGLQHRVIELIHKIVRLSFFTALAVGIVINLTPHLFLSVYHQSEAFIDAAIPVLRVISIAMLLQSFAVIWLNSVTGTGNAKINLIIEAVAITIYCIYVYAVVEVLQMPITWGWGSEWLYWLTMFIPSFLYIKSGKWKGIKM
ncbi:MATE family efflux transporter [Chitinophagaceae bacterium LWZ2-11]